MIRRWFLSLRPYSFTASLMPVALALVLAVEDESRSGTGIPVWVVALFTISALLFHAGTNVLNDYYDYLHGVDGPNDPDPTHAISRGIVTPRFMLVSGRTYFLLGVLAGLPIGFVRGGFFVVAGLTGALGAYLYTGYRFSFKYVALGDPLVFLLMGPAMVVMGVWAFTGSVAWTHTVLSLPIALLVTAILHGNNLRDISRDRAADIRTLAGMIGPRGSRYLFFALLSGAYLGTILLITLGWINSATLIVLATVPAGGRQIVRVMRTENLGELIDLPRACATIHLTFSILYLVGIAI